MIDPILILYKTPPIRHSYASLGVSRPESIVSRAPRTHGMDGGWTDEGGSPSRFQSTGSYIVRSPDPNLTHDSIVAAFGSGEGVDGEGEGDEDEDTRQQGVRRYSTASPRTPSPVDGTTGQWSENLFASVGEETAHIHLPPHIAILRS
jgi:hypothetical protein